MERKYEDYRYADAMIYSAVIYNIQQVLSLSFYEALVLLSKSRIIREQEEFGCSLYPSARELAKIVLRELGYFSDTNEYETFMEYPERDYFYREF